MDEDRGIDLKKKATNKPFTKKCSVCGDHAPEHIHYGSITCFSCRAFFRRSVPKAHLYVCPGGKACEIGVGTRKNCQFCRYQACLRSGMRPSWVLTENEKRERMEKKRKNAGIRQTDENHVKNPLPDDVFSAEDSNMLLELMKTYVDTRKKCEIDNAVVEALTGCTRNVEAILPRWASFDFFAVQYSRVAKFSVAISEFAAFDENLQRRLLQVNMESMTSIKLSSTFKTRYQAIKLSPHKQLKEIKELNDISNIGRNSISIEQIFTKHWATDEEHYVAYIDKVSTLESLIGTDRNIALLFQLVNLFNPLDNIFSLAERKAIENAQSKYLDLLIRYLRYQFGGRSSRKIIARFLPLLSDLRQLTDKKKE